MNNVSRYSPRALNDLYEIFDYIKYELKNAEAANNTINGILLKVDNIRDFPEAGSILFFLDNIDSGYRYVRYKNYLAFYSINQKNEIFVERILYSGRDYMSLLMKKRVVNL